MAIITVRHLVEGFRRRLRIPAARYEQAMDEAFRAIARVALGDPNSGQHPTIRERIALVGGAAPIAAAGRRARRAIAHADAPIAAITPVHGAALATRNILDFEGRDRDLLGPSS